MLDVGMYVGELSPDEFGVMTALLVVQSDLRGGYIGWHGRSRTVCTLRIGRGCQHGR
jgi:hypothetical protein